MTFECYSQRLLNPFRGIVSCVSYRSADAVTVDGIHWDIYVSNEALLEETDDDPQPQVSDIRFGSWSARQGLKRGPIYPSDDFMQMEVMGNHLYEHLLTVSDRIPFPLRDAYELWLLDPEGRPLALLDSACHEQNIDSNQAIDWRPGLDCRQTFTSAVTDRLAEYDPGQDAISDYLATYINCLAGNQPAAQVFRRRTDRSGDGRWGINLPAALERRSLQPHEFPPYLLEARRHDALHMQLVRDFIRWQAPWQLLLPDLDSDRRSTMERHARAQPLKVARNYLLYPDIIDRSTIDAARIEAQLRMTQHKDDSDEQIMPTFYIELGPEA